MKNKIIFYLFFALILFPHFSLAAVNLPWSTTYNCNEWKTSNGQNPNCDSMWEGGGWTCDNSDGTYKEEQITAAANYSGGGGGKGQRHWLGDGVNNTSGGMSASFLSSQTEIWVRWYMRYEQGFEWNPYLMNQKILYFDPVSFPRLIVEYYGQDKVQIYSYASSQGYPSAEGNGWNTMMANGGTDARGNKTSDGQWHLWEFHVKIDTNGTDGILELWIDNNMVINVTNANLATAPLTTLLIGSNGFTPGNGRCMFVDYDDIAISNTGPIGGNTPPPSGGNPPSNNSGNDSSASGGSGCGFIKDNGKGPRAKGEGLALMIMLIIILAGIAIVRKIAINKGSKGIEHIKKMIYLMSCSKCIWLLIMVITSTALVNTSHAAVLAEQNFDDPIIANKYATLGEHTWLPGGWGSWLQAGNCNTDSSMSINSNAAYRGSAGLDIYYHMDDDPRGDCALHMDNNTSLVHTFLPGLSHYFVRGYFRLPLSTAQLCSQPWIQRKLIYFKPQNYNTNGWNFIVNAWPWNQTQDSCSTDGYNVSVTWRGPLGTDTIWGSGSPGFINPSVNNHLYVNTWYYIETEIEYGAYGHDTMRIWLAPAGTSPRLIFERTDLTWRSEQDVANNVTIGTIEIGRQVDIVRSSFSQGIDEHRYWDEIVIGTTPIGPVDGGSGGNTPPPPSGGDATSSNSDTSGGSGCGFVKDENSKGQGAKKEGGY
ncbi:MAG: hypothetical protein WA277_13480 [Nitrospirota bacterium]